MTCNHCQAAFEIREEDMSFYQELKVPPPTLCPPCRMQRRMAFRNERSYHHRTCDLCKKSIVSVFAADSKYTVYCPNCWWSDKWDPMNFGRAYDFSNPFFPQFHALSLSVPHISLHQDGTSENCEYVNYGMNNKNCYLAYCIGSEDVYYSHALLYCKNCIDCSKCASSQLCYECIDCFNCYQLFFAQDCKNCSESAFLKDCIGCKSCFASAGLHHREYVFCNQQLTKEEYEQKISAVVFTPESIQEWTKKRDEISREIPHLSYHGAQNENVTGEYLDHSRNLYHCFDAMELQDSSYCDTAGIQSHHLMDCSNIGIGTEFSYECSTFTKAVRCIGLYNGRAVQDSTYSQYCYESDHLFGCISLKRKKHCILNQQYSPEEYEIITENIREQMLKAGEYGEFFPMELSAFPYEETLAAEYFPIDPSPPVNRPFKIIPQERSFYDRFHLPDPTLHPDLRHRARIFKRNPRKLWKRPCEKCRKELETSYGPERSEKVYCEECYSVA